MRWATYREALKQHNLNTQTLSRLHILREDVPATQRIHLTGDGSFTNKTILRRLINNRPDSPHI